MTEARAWLLGIIYGDGGIGASKPCVSIHCEAADVDILFKAATIIGVPAKFIDSPGCKKLVISSRKFRDALTADFNIDENKCAEMPWPNLPTKLYRDFVRGLLDSDGSWLRIRSRTSTQPEKIGFSYCSINRAFVERLELTIRSAIEVCPRSVRTMTGRAPFREGGSIPRPSHVLEYGHFDCITLGNWLYPKGTEHMRGARKYATWLELSAAPVRECWIKRHRDHLTKLASPCRT